MQLAFVFTAKATSVRSRAPKRSRKSYCLSKSDERKLGDRETYWFHCRIVRQLLPRALCKCARSNQLQVTRREIRAASCSRGEAAVRRRYSDNRGRDGQDGGAVGFELEQRIPEVVVVARFSKSFLFCRQHPFYGKRGWLLDPRLLPKRLYIQRS